MNEEEISDLKLCDSVGRLPLRGCDIYLLPFISYGFFHGCMRRLCFCVYLGMDPGGLFLLQCDVEFYEIVVCVTAVCKSTWLSYADTRLESNLDFLNL